MSSQLNNLFGFGAYTSVGAAFAVVCAGSGNWTGAYNGVGDCTLTWGGGYQIDVTQSTVLLSAGTTNSRLSVSAQADATVRIIATTTANVALESVVHFLVVRDLP